MLRGADKTVKGGYTDNEDTVHSDPMSLKNRNHSIPVILKNIGDSKAMRL
jgi:hypothetical protein